MKIVKTAPARWTRVTALRLFLSGAALVGFLLASGASLKWD